MKKLTKLFLAFCMVALITVVTACNNEKKTYKVTFETNGGSIVKSISVEENKELTFPTDPTKEGYKFLGWYLDEKLENKVPTPYVVTENITFYASWEMTETTEILVNTVEQRASFDLFTSNKSVKENKKTEYFDLTKPFMVGDDNPWVVKPSVSFARRNKIDGSVEFNVQVPSWTYEIVLNEVLEDGTTKEVATELIDKIDVVNCTIDFSEKAIGKLFQVKVTPTGLTTKQQENKDKYRV